MLVFHVFCLGPSHLHGEKQTFLISKITQISIAILFEAIELSLVTCESLLDCSYCVVSYYVVLCKLHIHPALNAYTHTRMHAHMHAHMHVRTHPRTHPRTHVRTHYNPHLHRVAVHALVCSHVFACTKGPWRKNRTIRCESFSFYL